MKTNSQTYKILISYFGKNFGGFQKQKNNNSIQATLESAFEQILGETIKITGSGRTDAGVHALEQPCHFTIETQKAKNRIAQDSFLHGLNKVLPNDIRVQNCVKKSGFHARKQAKKKSYLYVLYLNKIQNPFLQDLVTQVTYPLDEKAMEKSSKHLLGRHDFSSFCASDSSANTKTREILEIRFHKKAPSQVLKLKGDDFLCIEITGTGFLKQMVRNIVGTLIEVGRNKQTPASIKKVLKAKDRKQAGPTAPAQGLYLKKVWY